MNLFIVLWVSEIMTQTPHISPPPKVTILMGVYNGAAYLPAQLASISSQSHSNWHLICSDDGSVDGSIDIIRHFARCHPGRVTLRHGPRDGFSANYMSLFRSLPADPGYLCLADQDDVWLGRKLARGLQCLDRADANPALTCGRRAAWDPRRDRIVLSPRLTRPFNLRNALIENVAAGNTIMLDPAAAECARRAALRTGRVFAHDWWLYLLLTAIGGTVVFDNDHPTILYRQHGGNAIGSGLSLGQQIHRKLGVLQGLFAQRVDQNLAALACVDELLTPEAREICRKFAEARQRRGLARLQALMRVAPYRQSQSHTFGFWGAAGLGLV